MWVHERCPVEASYVVSNFLSQEFGSEGEVEKKVVDPSHADG